MAGDQDRILLLEQDSVTVEAIEGAVGTGRLKHAESVEDALRLLDALVFSAVFLNWPASRAALSVIGERYPDTACIAVTDGSPEQVKEAMRAGALDALDRRGERGELDLCLKKILAASAARAEQPPKPPRRSAVLLGESKAMTSVKDLIARVAPGVATVLIRGESGTGKELVARALHELGPRSSRPFVNVHCAALPDSLLESELFGHDKGAFTGATCRKPGRVEVAEGGTLFLDEIGDITPAVQVKLLRLLQDREYERLGSAETRRADVRFVAATHRDLEGMILRGEFREDLFYRLNVVPLWLPPLRARRDDIPLLSEHFCHSFAEANGKPGTRLGPDALRELRAQRWVGNVRQLQNFIERLVILSDSAVLSDADVRRELSQHQQFSTEASGATSSPRAESATGTTSGGPPSEVLPLTQEIHAAEKRALQRALDRSRGNRSLAARMLGIARATLYAKMEEHGLS